MSGRMPPGRSALRRSVGCCGRPGLRHSAWYQEWTATARRAEQLAGQALDGGSRETARLAFFPASTYYRTAGVMLMGSRPTND